MNRRRIRGIAGCRDCRDFRRRLTEVPVKERQRNCSPGGREETTKRQQSINHTRHLLPSSTTKLTKCKIRRSIAIYIRLPERKDFPHLPQTKQSTSNSSIE